MNFLLARGICFALGLAAMPPVNKGVECSLQQVMDPQEGYAAFTYFVPNGWTPQTSFNWNGPSYVAQYSASTPDRQYEVTHLEPMFMQHNAGNGVQETGMHFEKATDFLRAVVSSWVQQGRASNVQIVDEVNTDIPFTDIQKLQLRGLAIGGMSHKVFRQAGFLKVKFRQNGTEEVANLATTVFANNQRNDLAVGSNHFVSVTDVSVVGPSLFVLVPSEPSPAKIKEAEIVSSSARITPRFLALCSVRALSMATAAFNLTRQQGIELQQKMKADTEKMMDNFKDSMALRDAQTHQFCNYIMDRQDYKGDNGDVVTVPTTYEHPWSNGQGEYILGDASVLDPHDWPPGNWQPLEKVRPGQND